MKTSQRGKKKGRKVIGSKLGAQAADKSKRPLVIDLRKGIKKIVDEVSYPLRKKKNVNVTTSESPTTVLRGRKQKINVTTEENIASDLQNKSENVIRTAEENLTRCLQMRKKKVNARTERVATASKKIKKRVKEEGSLEVLEGELAGRECARTKKEERGILTRNKQKSISLHEAGKAFDIAGKKKEKQRKKSSESEDVSKKKKRKSSYGGVDVLEKRKKEINRQNAVRMSDRRARNKKENSDTKAAESDKVSTVKNLKRKTGRGKKKTSVDVSGNWTLTEYNSSLMDIQSTEHRTASGQEVGGSVWDDEACVAGTSSYLEAPHKDYAFVDRDDSWISYPEVYEEEEDLELSKSKYRVQYQMLRDGKFVVAMKHLCALYFNGKINIRVVKGAIEVMGSTITPENGENIDLYSPRGYSMLFIKTSDCQNIREPDKDVIIGLINDGLSTKKSKEFFDWRNKKTFDVVLVLSDLENAMTKYLESHIQNLFECSISGCDEQVLEHLHCCLIPSGYKFTEKFYKESPEWKNVVQEICTSAVPPRLMGCGGKGVGKSTFLRYVINCCLPSIGSFLYIDLDPGQCEFTIPGCVSATIISKPVLGPNFTHLTQPERMLFVGDVNIANCPNNYLQCVQHLVEFCQQHEELAALPWVINTMGFCTDIGVDLNIDAIRLISPTHLVQLESGSSLRNFPRHLTPQYVNVCNKGWLTQPAMDELLTYKHFCIDSEAEYKWKQGFGKQSTKAWGGKPAGLRNMVILSYLSKMISPETRDLPSVVPYRLPWSSVAIHVSHEPVPPTQLLTAINGNLVALCSVNEEDMLLPDDDSLPRTLHSTPVAPCYGFGVVRGIDTESKMFYVITPEPYSNLAEVNCLIMGNVFLPQSVYLNFDKLGHVPYVVTNSATQQTSEEGNINSEAQQTSEEGNINSEAQQTSEEGNINSEAQQTSEEGNINSDAQQTSEEQKTL